MLNAHFGIALIDRAHGTPAYAQLPTVLSRYRTNEPSIDLINRYSTIITEATETLIPDYLTRTLKSGGTISTIYVANTALYIDGFAQSKLPILNSSEAALAMTKAFENVLRYIKTQDHLL